MGKKEPPRVSRAPAAASFCVTRHVFLFRISLSPPEQRERGKRGEKRAFQAFLCSPWFFFFRLPTEAAGPSSIHGSRGMARRRRSHFPHKKFAPKKKSDISCCQTNLIVHRHHSRRALSGVWHLGCPSRVPSLVTVVGDDLEHTGLARGYVPGPPECVCKLETWHTTPSKHLLTTDACLS